MPLPSSKGQGPRLSFKSAGCDSGSVSISFSKATVELDEDHSGEMDITPRAVEMSNPLSGLDTRGERSTGQSVATTLPVKSQASSLDREYGTMGNTTAKAVPSLDDNKPVIKAKKDPAMNSCVVRGRTQSTDGGKVEENNRKSRDFDEVERAQRSAPVSKVTTPIDGVTAPVEAKRAAVLTATQAGLKDHIAALQMANHDDDKSMFSGIREKLQDRFHDNINAVIEKIEEISGDESLGEALERRLRKSDSLDSNKSYNSAQSSAKGGVPARQPSSVSRESSTDSDVFEWIEFSKTTGQQQQQKQQQPHKQQQPQQQKSFVIAKGKPESSSTVQPPQGKGTTEEKSSHSLLDRLRHSSNEKSQAKNKSRTPSIEFRDDFYTEPADEYFSCNKPTELSHSLTTKSKFLKMSSSPDTKRSRFPFLSAKHRNNTPSPVGSIESSKSVPLSMSSLLQGTDKLSPSSEKCTNGTKPEDTQQFFDPKEDAVSQATAPVKKTNTEDVKSKKPIVDKPESPPTDQPTVDAFTRTLPIEITQLILVVSCVLLAVLVVFPLPSFLSGFLYGSLFATVGWQLFQLLLYKFVFVPPRPRKPYVIPDVETLPPLSVPRAKPSSGEEEKFKGWMNELGSYDPNCYHISNTKSVYAQLEGTQLRLQTPKQPVPRRVLWNDPPIPPLAFIKQRHFDLAGSKVELLPPGLVRKRLWSKKYPICIVLKKLGNKKVVKEPDVAKPIGFEGLPSEVCEEGLLFLFARTGREKEEWYRRFMAATQCQPLFVRLGALLSHMEKQPREVLELKPRRTQGVPERLGDTSFSSLSAKHNSDPLFEEGASEMTMIASNKDHNEAESEEEEEEGMEKCLLQYLAYMARCVPSDAISGARDGFSRLQTVFSKCDPSLVWANALLSRLFLDFLKEQYWAGKVKEKIEKKLSKIHLPYFIDTLTVTAIDLGTQMPVIQRASQPYMDERGLWLDLDIAYSGGFTMTLETKVNLMKLKRTAALPIPVVDEKPYYDRNPAIRNSDEEDSAESSTDEEVEEEVPANGSSSGGAANSNTAKHAAGGASKKLLRLVDKIAASKYFQHATDNKYVKRAMEGVSNTKLVLTVEIESCTGTLALNIPPPPTDRLWYGFRSNPELELAAKPRIGQRDVTVSHLTDWIEKKLAVEFQKVLVLPNMEDEVIPLMCDPASSRREVNTD